MTGSEPRADPRGPATGSPLGRSNPRVKQLRRLVGQRAEREAAGLVVVEGPTLVAEVLRRDDLTVDRVLHEVGRFDELAGEARAGGVPTDAVAEGVLGSVLSTVTPQPVVALVRRPAAALGEVVAAAQADGRPLLVLAGVADPGNAGTLVRSGEAAGVAGVVLTPGTVDLFAPKVVRASAGAVLRVPVVAGAQVGELVDAARAAAIPLVGAVPAGGVPVDQADLVGAVALVIGSEAHGVPADVEGALDATVSIPMEPTVESLNAAVAGSVVLFEAARQRRAAARGPGAAQLVSRASHELRSPLTALQGFTRLLVDRWDRLDDAKKQAMLADVRREGERLARMVGEVLDASRVEAGRLRLARQPLDLPALVHRAIERVRAEHPDLVVAVDLPPDLPRVEGDPARLERLVANLLENAAKYGEGHDVAVTAEAADGQVALTVADQGRGMAPDELARAFRPEPGDAPGRPSGAGLGLWLARAIAEAHGGALTVDSAPAQGTRATLALPTTPPTTRT